MISIRCSILESVRKNPAAYGQLLAAGDGQNNGGTHGMFACLQDVARLVHLGEITEAEAVKELHRKFLRFNDTPENKRKQGNLVEQLVKYCKQYDKNNFEFIDSWRLMKWDFSPDTRLSGRTPWVVSNDEGYFSYILSENGFDWRSELRFPLFQKYLSENTIECHLNEMNVGIYSLADNKFIFKVYSAKEIADAIKETNGIFKNVYSEYKKKK